MKQYLHDLFAGKDVTDNPVDIERREQEGFDALLWRRLYNRYGLIVGDECNQVEIDAICETMAPDAHTKPGQSPGDADYKPSARLQRGEDAFLVVLALQAIMGDIKGRYPAWQRFCAAQVYHRIMQDQIVPRLPAMVLRELKDIGTKSAKRRRKHWEALEEGEGQ